MICAISLALQLAVAAPAVPPHAAARTAGAPVPAMSASDPNGDDAGRTARKVRKRRIVVDAGHGGVDPGMSGPIGTRWKIREKDITLQVSRRLATALQERGLDVVMTRTADTLIDLYDRGRIANDREGDLFISIHVNAANPRWKHPAAARGFETYFLAEAKTEDAKRVERMENESVRFETDAQANKNDPLSFIINDMAQNEHLRESSELASMIQARLGKVEPGPSRGVKQAGFIVLTTAYMPAVLVEIGFGSNPGDAAFMKSPTHQRELANSIADAAVEYLEHYERRIAGGTPER
jgi:N-acetylmuramoyl-L-alanine amidase